MGLLLQAETAFATDYSNPCLDTGFSCGLFNYQGAEGDYTYGPGTNGHNCTTYIAWLFWNTLPVTKTDARFTKLNGLGDASQWATRAASFGFPVSKTATANSVAQWNYGHVAFVESVTLTNGSVSSIVVSEDNIYVGTDPTVRYSQRRRIYKSSSSTWPDNFIDFGITNGGSGGGGKPPVMQIVTPSATSTN